MSETLQELADIPKDFLREGTLFVRRCTKPDKREFIKISQAVGMGFLIMGAIGYFIKLSKSVACAVNPQEKHPDSQGHAAGENRSRTNIASSVHIPVNNILVGGA
ncbi:hypothetical protein F9C07_11848 [Aspergillus flavus]|uniref:Protein translocation complex subunit Sss1 n=2 Tax=Aspergillus flavus TaxID=5059 RepID=A0A7U2N2N2_ASPFN|nr:hypothetical protein F9C07_11848 [Aspergillus flavus]RMZ42818.1 protein translocation complex subunit Sss1 [Aspergillus flavus]